MSPVEKEMERLVIQYEFMKRFNAKMSDEPHALDNLLAYLDAKSSSILTTLVILYASLMLIVMLKEKLIDFLRRYLSVVWIEE